MLPAEGSIVAFLNFGSGEKAGVEGVGQVVRAAARSALRPRISAIATGFM
jgi:hypothetical protein